MITCGFFGKLPGMGDFVSRGWLTGAREGLDALLQEAIGELLASSTVGRETISQAPCVVLSIRPGIIGEQGLLAVLVPSHDRVGRTFPLCAGVQWTDDGRGSMGWPSPDYAKALLAGLLPAIAVDATPDELLSEIVAVGDPRNFPRIFGGLGGDETLPRLGSELNLLRIQGPFAAMSPVQQAWCSMLNDASDVLGIRIDEAGVPQDFFVCRRFASGGSFAAMFDGNWVERGWSSYETRASTSVSVSTDVPNMDEDATRPNLRAIDTGTAAPDSPERS